MKPPLLFLLFLFLINIVFAQDFEISPIQIAGLAAFLAIGGILLLGWVYFKKKEESGRILAPKVVFKSGSTSNKEFTSEQRKYFDFESRLKSRPISVMRIIRKIEMAGRSKDEIKRILSEQIATFSELSDIEHTRIIGIYRQCLSNTEKAELILGEIASLTDDIRKAISGSNEIKEKKLAILSKINEAKEHLSNSLRKLESDATKNETARSLHRHFEDMENDLQEVYDSLDPNR